MYKFVIYSIIYPVLQILAFLNCLRNLKQSLLDHGRCTDLVFKIQVSFGGLIFISMINPASLELGLHQATWKKILHVNY